MIIFCRSSKIHYLLEISVQSKNANKWYSTIHSGLNLDSNAHTPCGTCVIYCDL